MVKVVTQTYGSNFKEEQLKIKVIVLIYMKSFKNGLRLALKENWKTGKESGDSPLLTEKLSKERKEQAAIMTTTSIE